MSAKGRYGAKTDDFRGQRTGCLVRNLAVGRVPDSEHLSVALFRKQLYRTCTDLHPDRFVARVCVDRRSYFACMLRHRSALSCKDITLVGDLRVHVCVYLWSVSVQFEPSVRRIDPSPVIVKLYGFVTS